MLRSPALAEAVVRRLKLYNDPEFNAQMRPGLFGLAPAKAPISDPDAKLRSESGLMPRPAPRPASDPSRRRA